MAVAAAGLAETVVQIVPGAPVGAPVSLATACQRRQQQLECGWQPVAAWRYMLAGQYVRMHAGICPRADSRIGAAALRAVAK